MAPSTRTKSKAKKPSRPNSRSKRMKLPSPQDNDTQNLEERTSTPDSTDGDAPSALISDFLAGGTHAFLFRSSTSDLTEIIEADQGSDVMTAEQFLSTLETCCKGLQILLNRRNSNASALALQVAPVDQKNREEVVRYFETYWTDCVMEYLTCEAAELDDRLRDGVINVKDEWNYAKLGRQILYASGTITGRNLDIDYPEWCRFTPKCVSQDIQEVLCQLEDTYHSFQQRIYLGHDTPEEFKLWYLIWINLKKTFILFNQHENGFPNQFYLMEEELFTHPDTRSLFEWVTTQLEFFCPQEIEELVGQYVKLVDRHLARSPNLPLSETSIQTLSSFPEQPEWSAQAHEALHHAVIRLNNLTDGPSLLRRFGKKVLFFLSDQGLTLQTPAPQWLPVPGVIGVDRSQDETSDLVLNTDVQSYGIPSRIAPLAELNEAVNSSSAGHEIIDCESSQDETSEELSQECFVGEEDQAVVPPESPTDEANKNSRLEGFKNYVPRGRNMISAYDYVYCPVPENRAYEVANSRLISRDLRTPGIISHGLRIEDLVNLPPPRCRTPGTWTSWKRRIPLGPFEVFGLLGTAIADRVLGRTKAPVTRPLAPPHVTSREECQHRKHKGKLAAKRDTRTRVTKASVVQKAGLRGGGSESTPKPDENPPGPPSLGTNPRYTSSPGDTPSRPPRPGPPEEQRPAPTNTDQNLANDQTLDATSLTSHDNPSPPSQGSHNSRRENENPFNARSPGTRVSSAGMRRVHTDQTPRVPLGQITIHEDEEEEEQEELDEGDITETSSSDLTSKTKEGVSSSDGGEPPVSFPPYVEHFKGCHPCPVYQGQYHHLCATMCAGKKRTTSNWALLDPRFFRGSLWEMLEEENRYVRHPDVANITEFYERYNLATIEGEERTLCFSNGASIVVIPQEDGVLYDVLNGPQPSHRPYSNPDYPGVFDKEMFDSVSKIETGEHSPTGSFGWTELTNFTSIDDLLSPRWRTGTPFWITYDSGTKQDQSRHVMVQLERFASGRWELLATVPQKPPPMSPHARDYDAIEGDDASEETRNNLPGYKNLLEHQSKLKENKEAHRKKQDEAKQQRQQEGQSQEGGQPQDTTGHQDEQNVDAVTGVPAGPDVVTTQPQSQVNVVDAGQSTTKDAENGKDGFKKDSKDDGESKPDEGEPADEQPKDDDDNDDDDSKGDNAAVAKPTATKESATTDKAPETSPRGPRTRGAARRAAEALEKAKKGNAGKKTQDNPTKPKTGKRKDRHDDSDDDKATTTKPKRKRGKA